MRVDAYGDEPRGIPNRVWLVPIVVLVAVAYFFWHRQQLVPYDPEAPLLRTDIDAEPVSFADTLARLQPEGPLISNVRVERGLRTAQGERPSQGELKIMFNLHWPSLPGRPSRRRALDRATARALVAPMEGYPEITKLGLVLKVPKPRKEVNRERMGTARGHTSAAKLFSFTRAAFERAAEELEPAAGRDRGVLLRGRAVHVAELLALGDFVVLEDREWVRGY